MNLPDAIEKAANLAYDHNAAHYVVKDDYHGWIVLHEEDPEVFAPGNEPRFKVYSDGVDQGHLDRGEITKDWELPD